MVEAKVKLTLSLAGVNGPSIQQGNNLLEDKYDELSPASRRDRSVLSEDSGLFLQDLDQLFAGLGKRSSRPGDNADATL